MYIGSIYSIVYFVKMYLKYGTLSYDTITTRDSMGQWFSYCIKWTFVIMLFIDLLISFGGIVIIKL